LVREVWTAAVAIVRADHSLPQLCSWLVSQWLI
jgi:hypothetical protein